MGERKTATVMVERIRTRLWLSTGQGEEAPCMDHGEAQTQAQQCQNDTSSTVWPAEVCWWMGIQNNRGAGIKMYCWMRSGTRARKLQRGSLKVQNEETSVKLQNAWVLPWKLMSVGFTSFTPPPERQGEKQPHLLKQRVLKLYGRKEISVSGWNNLELKSAVNSKASLHQHGLSWESWGLPALSCKALGTGRARCLFWSFPALFLWWWMFSWSAVLPVPVLRCIREQPREGKCLLRDTTRVEHPLKCCQHHRQLFGAFLMI